VHSRQIKELQLRDLLSAFFRDAVRGLAFDVGIPKFAFVDAGVLDDLFDAGL
jgi:hypothetical protein